MPKRIIEFKLWNGKVPYFVEDMIHGLKDGNNYYGISHDDDVSHLPSDITTINRAAFISQLKLFDIVKGYTGEFPNETPVYMTEQEKEDYADGWLTERGL